MPREKMTNEAVDMKRLQRLELERSMSHTIEGEVSRRNSFRPECGFLQPYGRFEGDVDGGLKERRL